jgi:hypothetical protein
LRSEKTEGFPALDDPHSDDAIHVGIPPPKDRTAMSYNQPPAPPAPQHHPESDRPSASRRTALVIHTIGDVAAAFLGLWIVLYLLDANQANVFVQFVEGIASWLAGWSQDIFTMENEHVRFALNYGLPALVYLFLGHGIAAKVRHG